MNKSLKVLIVGTLLGFLSAGSIVVASKIIKRKKEKEIEKAELKELERLKMKYEN